MRRRTVIIVAAAVALLACWVYASAWWTLWNIREAAASGDAARFTSYVDFAAVRKDAEAQVRADWPSTVAILRLESAGGGDLRTALAHRLDFLAGPDAVLDGVERIHLR